MGVKFTKCEICGSTRLLALIKIISVNEKSMNPYNLGNNLCPGRTPSEGWSESSLLFCNAAAKIIDLRINY